MCGIHCILDISKELDSQNIQEMSRYTSYRGSNPPQNLLLAAENYHIFFGHNLLPINNTTDFSQQPFSKAEQDYVLVFNGEIYNWKFLDKKFNFTNQSNSDTETLFEYLKIISQNPTLWGDLEGIFAFVFWDKKQNKILSGRDNWGVKPLYYFFNQKQLVFSSEIQAIFASNLISKKLNIKSLAHYLHFKFAPIASTFFQDIHSHEKELIIWNLNKPFEKLSQKNDIQEAFIFGKENRKKLVESTELLLKKAIQNQYSDLYPPALMLSGGVDSTLLLALSQEMGYQIPSFSIVTDEKNFTQDAYFARKASQQYNSRLYEVKITEKNLPELPELFQKADQPIGDSALLSTYLLSEEAKKLNFRVLWSGAGADELFAGYNRHQAFKYYLKMPKMFFKKMALFFPKSRLATRFFDSISRNNQETFLKFCSLHILDKNFESNLSEKWTLEEALDWDRTHYLPEDVLLLTDFWAMQNTVEVRLPFLDKNLSNFARQVPAEIHLFNDKKYLLKELLNKKNGKIYTERKKEGFGIPFGTWLLNTDNQFIMEVMQKKDALIFEFVAPAVWQNLWHKHLSQKADYSQEIFALLALAWWLEKHF
ncbi:MAG: asparagine synthase (glutamine-hydrolyzing) [Thermonemataceae bacterium]|nr:asparagine synthase (glutamine-hydrolyzing) [Thermonemataceae bacterium]